MRRPVLSWVKFSKSGFESLNDTILLSVMPGRIFICSVLNRICLKVDILVSVAKNYLDEQQIHKL